MNDGGYYAIKGFAYQFDSTLLGVLDSKQEVAIENTQDWSINTTYVQVKYKEKQNFAKSKIKDAVLSIFADYKNNVFQTSPNFILTAYFKDRKDGEDYSIGADAEYFFGDESTSKLVQDFISCFKVVFCTDYLAQNNNLLGKIESEFKVSKHEAYFYYSLFQSEIIRIIIHEEKDNRKITFDDLKRIQNESSTAIFYSNYQSYLTEQDFSQLIHDKYFSSSQDGTRKVFVIPFSKLPLTNSIKLLKAIEKKYVKAGFTRSPILYFPKADQDDLNKLKNKLIEDDHRYFSDGTFFAGGKVHQKYLVGDDNTKNNTINPKFRFVSDKDLCDWIMKNESGYEIFDFYTEFPAISVEDDDCIRQIPVNDIDMIINMLQKQK